MLSAWLTGFVMGVAGSIPIAGPTTMLVLGFGLHGRVRAATSVALGSALPEGIWAALALWGFGALLRSYSWAAPAAEVAATLILLAVGTLLLLRPPVNEPREDDAFTGAASMARSFALGLSLTALNPTLLFNWGAAVTLAVSLGAITAEPENAIPFGVGVVSGIVAWFALVLQLLARHHRRISPALRVKLLRAMGLVLLTLGLAASVRLLYDLNHSV